MIMIPITLIPSHIKQSLTYLTGLFCIIIFSSYQPSITGNYSFFPPSSPYFQYIGRFDFSNEKGPRFGWSGSQIRFKFEGTSCKVILRNISEGTDAYKQPHKTFYNIFINEAQNPIILEAKNGAFEYLIAQGLPDATHSVTIFKRTEAHTGIGEFWGVLLDKGKSLVAQPTLQQRKIEFIGDSITCGYGNEGDSARCHFSGATENNYLAYGALTARSLKAEYMAISFSGIGALQNYNGDRTRTMPIMYDRIYPQNDTILYNFATSFWRPDVVVINLGTNDYAHENPPKWEFITAYAGLVDKVRRHYPTTTIVCALSPMVTDSYPKPQKKRSTLSASLQVVVNNRRQYGDANIHYFEMSEQGKLGYGCDFHPSLAQHQKNADELTQFLKKIKGW